MPTPTDRLCAELLRAGAPGPMIERAHLCEYLDDELDPDPQDRLVADLRDVGLVDLARRAEVGEFSGWSREHRILFSDPMVRRLLGLHVDQEPVGGNLFGEPKTETRRLITASTSIPRWRNIDWAAIDRAEPRGANLRVPYQGDSRLAEIWAQWRRGDRMPVCEAWRPVTFDHAHRGVEIEYRADGGTRMVHAPPDYDFDGWARRQLARPIAHWRPSIFLPGWASRIVLVVEDVHSERLQAITGHGALREGIERRYEESVESVRGRFAALWDSINRGRASWESNPWVWVTRFYRMPEVSGG